MAAILALPREQVVEICQQRLMILLVLYKQLTLTALVKLLLLVKQQR